MHKFILDTDIGCDSDDCMALGWLLACENIDLLAVTTVSVMAERRAYLAKVICQMTGLHIPVAYGNSTALDGSCLQSFISGGQDAQIDRYPHGELVNEPAIELMRRIIEENPHEVTLAAIGQLTNIALLFAVYPHIPELLRDLVIMGGRFGDCDISKWGYTEWNVKCDPLAAKIVLNSRVPLTYIVGVELTSRFSKPASEVAASIGMIPHMRPVADAIRTNKLTWFHDPFTLWAYLNRDSLEWRGGIASVDLTDSRGVTTAFTDGNGNHRLLTDSGIERFFDDYARTFKINWK